jgi:hypothetical protein
MLEPPVDRRAGNLPTALLQPEQQLVGLEMLVPLEDFLEQAAPLGRELQAPAPEVGLKQGGFATI